MAGFGLLLDLEALTPFALAAGLTEESICSSSSSISSSSAPFDLALYPLLPLPASFFGGGFFPFGGDFDFSATLLLVADLVRPVA